MALSTTTTRAAATTNMLSIRQAMAGPAPPQSYAVFCKAVLRYRQKRVYILAFASVALLLPIATFPVVGADALLAYFYPTTWLCLGLAWTGTLPVFVTRKQFLKTSRQTWPDRFSQYRALLAARQAHYTVLAYTASALLISYSYILLLSRLAASMSYQPLVTSPGRNTLSANERYFYLTVSMVVTILAYAVKQIVASRDTLEFSTDSKPIPARIQARLVSRLPALPALAASANVTFLGLYLLSKRAVLRFVIYTLPGGRLLRPFLLNMLRINQISASLILAGLCASTSALVILEVANTLADVYYSQPLTVSTFSSEPRRTLLDGLQSSDLYIRHFAFQEFRQIALTDKTRRADIFRDIKSGSFQSYSNECLKVLGISYRTLQRKGQPPRLGSSGQRGAVPAPTSATAHAHSVGTTRMPIKQENAFRPSQRSIFDSLSEQAIAGPSTAQLAPLTSNVAVTAVSTSVSKVPAIFQRKAQEVISPKVQEKAKEAKEEVAKARKSLAEISKGVMPRTITSSKLWQHLFTPLLHSQVSTCIPYLQTDCWAASALAAFMMASLHEDQYGVAQGDIAKVLEAFVLYLDVVEAYSRELVQFGEEGRFPSQVVQKQIAQGVQPLRDVLREGIVGILQTFSAYLDDIKFPPSIAARLQEFV